MNAPELTTAERETVDRFETAEAAEESLLERVIRATHRAVCNGCAEDPSASPYWQRIADAAVATMKASR